MEERRDNDVFATAFRADAVSFTKNWPLVDDPRYVLTIMVSYVSLILIGKRFMRNRPAFNIKPIMLVHNFSLVALSAYMFTKFFTCSVLSENFQPLPFFCELADVNVLCHHTTAAAMWWWYISKMFDLLDTAYHVLRKRPVSFLHAYHHTSVVFLAWILVRYLPAGSSIFGPMVNSLVHTVMYFYYGLSTMGPHMQKYLWWKKYLTRFQMIQFIILFSYTVVGYMYHVYQRSLDPSSCQYPPRLVWLQSAYSVTLFILFANFYYQAYISKRAAAARSISNANNNTHDANNSAVKPNAYQNGH